MGVIDRPRKELDPQIWRPDNTMREPVKDHILDMVDRVQPYGEIQNITLIGSIATYNWDETSDIDVNVLLDPYSDEDLDSARKVARTIMATEMLPDTDHPMSLFVMTDPYDMENSEGVYDIDTDEWTKGPGTTSLDIDKYLSQFESQVSSLDLTFAELDRDIIDYDIILNLSKGEGDDMDLKLQDKVREIDKDIAMLAGEYSILASARRDIFGKGLSPQQIAEYGTKSALPENVIYKLLHRYYYSQLIISLSDVRGEDGAIDTPEEVDKVKSTMGRIRQSVYGLVS